MIVNGIALLEASPIKDMATTKIAHQGVSYGLTEAGYDIRLKQTLRFCPPTSIDPRPVVHTRWVDSNDGMIMASWDFGTFVLASAMEEFQMPESLVGVVHDKSTWARRGISVFNTVIEPGWKGFLTLEIVYHGQTELIIPAGSGIAQVLFHSTTNPAAYEGKYQNQSTSPTPAIFDGN